MKLKKALHLAINTVVHSKLRSWLTILGIVIGIAAVVSIISVSEGAKKNLEEQLGSLGADVLTITPGAARAAGASGGFRGGNFGGDNGAAISSKAKNLTTQDVLIVKSVSGVKYVMGIISGRAEVSYLSKSASTNIQGVDPSVWNYVTTSEVREGRSLVNGDSDVAVIGGRIANNVFEGNIEINRQINIGGKSLRIIGVLKEGGGSEDNIIIMPISTARDILKGIGKKDFGSIQVKIENPDDTDVIIADMNKRLMMSRGILQEKNKDFSITSPKSFQERISSTVNSMSLFLAAIAAISLVVGAVGISNTMFTSVLEKTKDIGIMKAIGAKNRDIMLIFLFKSGILGLIGGIGGVMLGILGSGLISNLGSGANLGRLSLSSTYVSPQLIIGAFLLSIAVGMIAGIIPAYRASKLKPVDALRY